MLPGLIIGHKSVICLSHLLLEDTLERRKDMLDKIPIIPRIPPAATKIINFYSIFPERGFRHGLTRINTAISTFNYSTVKFLMQRS